MEDSFRLLFVGTTNLGRSAMAERILREAIDHRWHWSASGRWIVESAGTRAIADQAMHPLVRQSLRERFGADPDFVSRPVTADLLRPADLVLTVGREQRAQVVARFPFAIRRTFTVLQFARLAERVATLTGDDSAELGRTLVRESLLARSDVPPGRGSDDDIADPIGRSLTVVRRRAADIERAVDSILSPLVVTSPSSRWAAQTAITRRAALADGAALPITRAPHTIAPVTPGPITPAEDPAMSDESAAG